MREIDVQQITEAVRDMCIKINHELSDDMKQALNGAEASEKSPLGKKILGQLQENLQIAESEMIPICQDTGMAVLFFEIGQDVHLVGGDFTDAVNEGVRQGYTEGYLRKSVVSDPLIRENTKDNTPAVIHTSIVPGEQVKITLAPKGFGSENILFSIRSDCFCKPTFKVSKQIKAVNILFQAFQLDWIGAWRVSLP